MTDILQYTPVLILIIFVVFIIIVQIILRNRKKKGTDTPESLMKFFHKPVDYMNVIPPFNIIFKFHTNDGNQIIYKEISNSRNCYFKIERYKFILECYDLDNKQTFYQEDTEHIVGWINDVEFIHKFHTLYVIGLNKGKITF